MKTTCFSYEINCPTCGKLLDAATPAEDPEATPSSGDYSICSGCGEILTFYEKHEVTNQLFLRKVEEDELKKVEINDPENHTLLVTLSNHFKSMWN